MSLEVFHRFYDFVQISCHKTGPEYDMEYNNYFENTSLTSQLKFKNSLKNFMLKRSEETPMARKQTKNSVHGRDYVGYMVTETFCR